MRLFGVIVLAGLLSGAAAFGVTLLGIQVVQCRSDPAGCGMAAAFQVLAVPVYVIVAMIAFGLAMAFANRLRVMAVTAIGLVAVTLLLFVIGLSSDAFTGRPTQLADLIDLLQLAVPFWATVAVQWFVIRFYLMRRMTSEVAS